MNLRDDVMETRSGYIPASIELTPKHAIESQDLPRLFPRGTAVYIADIGIADTATLVAAARRLRDLGYEPIPHIAARRLTTTAAFAARIGAMTQEAGVRDVLVIGGGLTTPAGEFEDTLAVLESGILDRHGIDRIGVAGHPEGSPDFPNDMAFEILRRKKAFSERTGAKMRIVTQFGFDADAFLHWANAVKQLNIDLPIHLGVAGPAKITTLLKYASMCGVGNSLNFLKKQARSLTGLAFNQSPDAVVNPIETRWRTDPATLIAQVHVFPFGGIESAAQWLERRGSWQTAMAA